MADDYGLMALNSSINQATNFAIGELNWKHTKHAMAIQQDYFRQNREAAVQIARDNWNMVNEYNSPAAVAQRYRDAGISPQAALSGAASGAGIGGSVGDSSAPMGSGSAPNMALLADNTMTLAALRETEARTAKLDAERENIEQDTVAKSNENSLFEIMKNLRESEARSKAAEAKLRDIESQYAEIEKTTDVKLKEHLTLKLLQDIKESISREDLNVKNQEKVEHEIANLDSSTSSNYAAAGEHSAAARNLDARTETENALREHRVEISKAESALTWTKQEREAINRDLERWIKDQKIARKPTESYWEMVLQFADRYLEYREQNIEKKRNKQMSERDKANSRQAIAGQLLKILPYLLRK